MAIRVVSRPRLLLPISPLRRTNRRNVGIRHAYFRSSLSFGRGGGICKPTRLVESRCGAVAVG